MPKTVPSELATLSYSSTQAGTYTLVGGVVSIKKPGGEVAEIKTTGLSDTSQTFRPGLQPEVGTSTFKIKYDPNDATHILLCGDVQSPLSRWWKMTFNDGNITVQANKVFQGFIKAWDESEDVEEANVMADVTIRVTGTVTSTVGTP